MYDGTVKIYSLEGDSSFKQVKHMKKSKKWISDIQFDNKDTKMAIG